MRRYSVIGADPIRLGDEPENWVADDRIEIHDQGTDSRVVPIFWVFVDAKKWGHPSEAYGWMPVTAGDERNAATWQTPKAQSKWDPLGVNRHVAIANPVNIDEPHLQGIVLKQIRGRVGGPREGWTIDPSNWIPIPPGGFPPAAPAPAPAPAAPPIVSTYASDYSRAQQERLLERLGKYGEAKARIEAAKAGQRGRQVSSLERQKALSEQRAAEYRQRQSDIDAELTRLEAEMSKETVVGVAESDRWGMARGYQDEPHLWVSDQQADVFDPVALAAGEPSRRTPKFWVYVPTAYWMPGLGYPTAWLGVLDGDERDPSTWKVIPPIPERPDAKTTFFAMKDPFPWWNTIRGRKGTEREGWTIDGDGMRRPPALGEQPAPGSGSPASTPVPSAPVVSTYLSDYGARQREAKTARYGQYADFRNAAQSAIDQAKARAFAARFGSPTVAGQEIERMMDNDVVGRMSYGFDESEFDERPYNDAFVSTKDAVRGEPDIFTPPPDRVLPRLREELRRFQAEEPSVRVLRIDTDATYEDLVGDKTRDLEAAVAELRRRLDAHERNPYAHQEFDEIIGLANVVSDLRQARPRGADTRVPVPLPNYAQGKVRCWQEGDKYVCSMRFFAPDGTGRVATAAARRPDLDEEAVAASLSAAGMDPVSVLGALPDAVGAAVGQRLVRDLAGAVLAISTRDDVVGAAGPAFVVRKGSVDAPLAATMALKQAALAGDAEAAREVALLREAAASPRGARIAALLNQADARLVASQQKPGIIDRALRFLGVK